MSRIRLAKLVPAVVAALLAAPFTVAVGQAGGGPKVLVPNLFVTVSSPARAKADTAASLAVSGAIRDRLGMRLGTSFRVITRTELNAALVKSGRPDAVIGEDEVNQVSKDLGVAFTVSGTIESDSINRFHLMAAVATANGKPVRPVWVNSQPNEDFVTFGNRVADLLQSTVRETAVRTGGGRQ